MQLWLEPIVPAFEPKFIIQRMKFRIANSVDRTSVRFHLKYITFNFESHSQLRNEIDVSNGTCFPIELSLFDLNCLRVASITFYNNKRMIFLLNTWKAWFEYFDLIVSIKIFHVYIIKFHSHVCIEIKKKIEASVLYIFFCGKKLFPLPRWI